MKLKILQPLKWIASLFHNKQQDVPAKKTLSDLEKKAIAVKMLQRYRKTLMLFSLCLTFPYVQAQDIPLSKLIILRTANPVVIEKYMSQTGWTYKNHIEDDDKWQLTSWMYNNLFGFTFGRKFNSNTYGQDKCVRYMTYDKAYHQQFVKDLQASNFEDEGFYTSGKSMIRTYYHKSLGIGVVIMQDEMQFYKFTLFDMDNFNSFLQKLKR